MVMATIRDGRGAGVVCFKRRGMRANLYIYSLPMPWVLEEAGLESCMLHTRLSAKYRETSPCLVAHCLPQLAVRQAATE